jgi:hypothetical protein
MHGNMNVKVIIYSECVSVSLRIQHAKCMRCIVICGLYGSTILFRFITQMARFSGKRNIRPNNVCFDFLYSFSSESFLILRRIQLDIIINVHGYTLYSCHFLRNLEFSRAILKKKSNYQTS